MIADHDAPASACMQMECNIYMYENHRPTPERLPKRTIDVNHRGVTSVPYD